MTKRKQLLPDAVHNGREMQPFIRQVFELATNLPPGEAAIWARMIFAYYADERHIQYDKSKNWDITNVKGCMKAYTELNQSFVCGEMGYNDYKRLKEALDSQIEKLCVSEFAEQVQAIYAFADSEVYNKGQNDRALKNSSNAVLLQRLRDIELDS